MSREIRIRQLRTELSFLYSTQASGGPNREKEMEDIRKQIEEMQKEDETVS